MFLGWRIVWNMLLWTMKVLFLSLFRELFFISVYVFITPRQKKGSLNSVVNGFLSVSFSIGYIKSMCISLGYWRGFGGLGSGDGGGDNLCGMNPHMVCSLRDGAQHFFWNLKPEVGTCSSGL